MNEDVFRSHSGRDIAAFRGTVSRRTLTLKDIITVINMHGRDRYTRFGCSFPHRYLQPPLFHHVSILMADIPVCRKLPISLKCTFLFKILVSFSLYDRRGNAV